MKGKAYVLISINIVQGKMIYDKIIIGAGLYGLYSADYCGKRGEKGKRLNLG